MNCIICGPTFIGKCLHGPGPEMQKLMNQQEPKPTEPPSKPGNVRATLTRLNSKANKLAEISVDLITAIADLHAEIQSLSVKLESIEPLYDDSDGSIV